MAIVFDRAYSPNSKCTRNQSLAIKPCPATPCRWINRHSANCASTLQKKRRSKCPAGIASCSPHQSQFRTLVASSASRCCSSCRLASLSVSLLVCFFCAVSWDWSLPAGLLDAARACPKTSVSQQASSSAPRHQTLVGEIPYLRRLRRPPPRLVRQCCSSSCPLSPLASSPATP